MREWRRRFFSSLLSFSPQRMHARGRESDRNHFYRAPPSFSFLHDRNSPSRVGCHACLVLFTPSLSLFLSLSPSLTFFPPFLCLHFSLIFSLSIALSLSLSGHRSLSIAQIALSLSLSPPSSFFFLHLSCMMNFSSIVLFPLSSLFFHHPSHFSLIAAHFFANCTWRRALRALYSL